VWLLRLACAAHLIVCQPHGVAAQTCEVDTGRISAGVFLHNESVSHTEHGIVIKIVNASRRS
jgi:hypothetical protein